MIQALYIETSALKTQVCSSSSKSSSRQLRLTANKTIYFFSNYLAIPLAIL